MMNWKEMFKYHFKWQLGSIIAIPLMYLLVDYFQIQYWASILIFNFVGALIFYPIDKAIFQSKEIEAINIVYPDVIFEDPLKQDLIKSHIEIIREEALLEIISPNWESAEPYCDWKYKVPINLQRKWNELTTNNKILIYFTCKTQTLKEEEE